MLMDTLFFFVGAVFGAVAAVMIYQRIAAAAYDLILQRMISEGSFFYDRRKYAVHLHRQQRKNDGNQAHEGAPEKGAPET